MPRGRRRAARPALILGAPRLAIPLAAEFFFSSSSAAAFCSSVGLTAMVTLISGSPFGSSASAFSSTPAPLATTASRGIVYWQSIRRSSPGR
eukprot:CAMPEP_0179360994 /NCGR_PEP_ID=MMETSP0797-20121207/80263_1 /TAXON_ID=47934 /ORGANISM="Dinophysis acuminata, Strain DAEP01" /LENGTH=91 /DNA_ID=CAMNT_0021076365 /DNA_START=149 /DNA_END=421 /DNA_ORIENTATION=+